MAKLDLDVRGWETEEPFYAELGRRVYMAIAGVIGRTGGQSGEAPPTADHSRAVAGSSAEGVSTGGGLDPETKEEVRNIARAAALEVLDLVAAEIEALKEAVGPIPRARKREEGLNDERSPLVDDGGARRRVPKGEQREKIFKAMACLEREGRLDPATVSDIARRAGLKPYSVVYVFGNRQAMIREYRAWVTGAAQPAGEP